MEAPKYVFVAYAEDRGTREGQRTLGLYLKAEDAHARVQGFRTPEWDDEDGGPPVWRPVNAFNQDHPESGAVHVTEYRLEGSQWWVAHVIQFEVR